MLRTVLRSRICWLGIPGFLFLFWAWRESGDYDTGAKIRVENRGYVYVRQRGGEVMWYWFWVSPEEYQISTRHDPLFEIVRDKTPEDTLPALSWAGFWLPEPFDHTHRDFDNTGCGCRVFVVSHWLLLLVYSGSWAGAFLWWQRRKDRLQPRKGS